MKRAASTLAVLAAAASLLSGCGGGDSDSVTDEGCTAEIKRQLADPSKATKDVPPQCKGISDDKLEALFKGAMASAIGTASPSPAAK